MDVQNRDWRRGLLRPIALAAVLQSGESHGYEVISQLEKLGLGTVYGGTLYPILRRLEDEGFLSSTGGRGEGGPGGKIYTVTEAGGEEARSFQAQWVALVADVNRVLKENLEIGRASCRERG